MKYQDVNIFSAGQKYTVAPSCKLRTGHLAMHKTDEWACWKSFFSENYQGFAWGPDLRLRIVCIPRAGPRGACILCSGLFHDCTHGLIDLEIWQPIRLCCSIFCGGCWLDNLPVCKALIKFQNHRHCLCQAWPLSTRFRPPWRAHGEVARLDITTISLGNTSVYKHLERPDTGHKKRLTCSDLICCIGSE